MGMFITAETLAMPGASEAISGRDGVSLQRSLGQHVYFEATLAARIYNDIGDIPNFGPPHKARRCMHFVSRPNIPRRRRRLRCGSARGEQLPCTRKFFKVSRGNSPSPFRRYWPLLLVYQGRALRGDYQQHQSPKRAQGSMRCFE